MKRFIQLLLALSLYSSAYAEPVCDNSTGIEQIEELVKASGNKVFLRQADFDSGTLRIKHPGLYVLCENIDFDPIPADEAKRTDKPLIGWFAVITVETDAGVIIDLNGKRIRATTNFIDNHFFNVFADIEFDNCPFPGQFFGRGNSNFIGDTTFVSGSNILVRNGTLARSSHWGIHGNDNNNIHMHNLRIRDFEVAGIEINGAFGATLKKIEVSGLEHIITTRSLFVGFLVIQGILAQLAMDNVPFAAFYLAQLEEFAALNPGFFNTPISEPDGSYFGIRISSGPDVPPVVPFPIDLPGCAFQAFIGEGSNPTSCIELENIFIHDLNSAPIETVSIGTNEPFGITGNFINLPLLGIFGLLRWSDAFPSGTFAPNAFLQAQLFASLVLEQTQPNILPPNFDTIAQSLGVTLAGPVTPDLTLFNNNVIPLFGFNFNAPFINVGNFGLRLDCGDTVKVKNVKICAINNNGQPGTELSQLPDGAFFEPTLTQTRYIGDDSWGFEFSADNNLIIENSKALNIQSTNGFIFGIDFINVNSNVQVKKTKSKNIIGFGDSQTDANPPAEAYGLRVRNSSGTTNILEHTSINTTAPRVAFGLATESTNGIVFDHCTACNTSATAADPGGPNNKTAYGFYSSQQSNNTTFKHCKEKHSFILGETTGPTNSIAAGYVFTDADTNSTVEFSSAHNNHSGGGTANGVRIDNGSSNTTVAHNKIVGNFADLPGSTGFGIIDTAAHSTATLIDNCVKNNSTANIAVNP